MDALSARAQALSELAYLPCAVALSWSLFATDGMPLTHDGLGLVWLEWYRRAYRAGDWLPLWTPFAANGHGSPAPILYHRLHAQVFGLLAVATTSLFALKVSIPLLLALGAAGIRRLGRHFGVRPSLAWTAGLLFMSANYTVVDWFVRGAAAELTAFMLVPWCIRHALLLFEDRAGPLRLAISSALLFYAHMMTFYYFVLVSSVLIVGRLFELGHFGARRVLGAIGRGAAFIALLTCAIGPYAAAVRYVVALTAVDDFKMRPDAQAYFPLSAYVLDPSFSFWRASLQGALSPEIGRWTLLALGALLLLAPRAGRAVWRQMRGLVVLAAVFLAVQPQAMSFVFDLVPGASKIQFPSRLLVYIVPVAILALAVAAEHAVRSFVPGVRAAAWAIVIVALAGQGNLAIDTQRGILASTDDEGRRAAVVTKKEIDAVLSDSRDVTHGRLAQYQEWQQFLPKGLPEQAAKPFLKASDGCTLASDRLTGGQRERGVDPAVQCGDVSFVVHGRKCEVQFSQYRSALLRITLSKPGEVRTAPSGLTVIELPHDGTLVTIRERSVLGLARLWLVEKWRRRS